MTIAIPHTLFGGRTPERPAAPGAVPELTPEQSAELSEQWIPLVRVLQTHAKLWQARQSGSEPLVSLKDGTGRNMFSVAAADDGTVSNDAVLKVPSTGGKSTMAANRLMGLVADQGGMVGDFFVHRIAPGKLSLTRLRSDHDDAWLMSALQAAVPSCGVIGSEQKDNPGQPAHLFVYAEREQAVPRHSALKPWQVIGAGAVALASTALYFRHPR